MSAPALPLSHRYEDRAPVERLCARVWGLGPRTFAELLSELAVEHDIGKDIVAKLERYGSLSAAMLKAMRADHFAPAPLRQIESER
jgi:hypothetical protein